MAVVLRLDVLTDQGRQCGGLKNREALGADELGKPVWGQLFQHHHREPVLVADAVEHLDTLGGLFRVAQSAGGGGVAASVTQSEGVLELGEGESCDVGVAESELSEGGDDRVPIGVSAGSLVGVIGFFFTYV